MDSYAVVATAVTIYVTALVSHYLWNKMKTQPLELQGKHVFITGGTKGLGRSLALQMAERGAHVTVTARTESDLKVLEDELKTRRKNEGQKFVCIRCDVTKHEEVIHSLEKAKEVVGVPHYVIPCAGAAFPGVFLDSSIHDFEHSMQLNYFGTLYVVHKASQMMREHNVKGHIVICASTLATMTFGGYSTYSPTKYALKGLAETLHNEFVMYGIRVQIFYPANMDTPGFENEEKTKPEFAKEIEGASKPIHPDHCAAVLLKEMETPHFHLYIDEMTNIFRIFSNGTTPQRNIAYEWLVRTLLSIAQPFFTIWTAMVVRKHGKNIKKDK